MDYKCFSAFAPATIANLSCGFDVLGMAIDSIGDEVTARFQDKREVTLEKITGDNKKLSLDPQKNTCTVGIIELLKKLKTKQGISVSLTKNLPLGSGLGSSAASSVAGLWATNHLLGNPFKKEELIEFAVESEKIACGNRHADNVAPCFLGGVILIKSCAPLDIIRINTKLDLFCVIVNPDIVVNTSDSRKILPKQIPLKLAVKQWGNIAGLVSGFHQNDTELIRRSMCDFIAEPRRSHLIPHFYEIKELAIQNGAIGCSISGSGPTIFALTDTESKALVISEKMKEPFMKSKIRCKSLVSKINYEGVKLI